MDMGCVETRDGTAWDAFQTRRHRLEPPLCPTPGVIEAMRVAIGEGDAPILLLGVTGAIVDAFDNLIVVDWSAAARGSVSSARPIDGDWRDPPLPDASCGAALGDGSLTCLAWPRDYARLFAMLRRLLRPGGRAAIRCYAAPEVSETPERVLADARQSGGFAAFKWRLAMALASETDQNVPVAAIKQCFDALVPDRAALAAATGWTRAAIDDVDAYAGSALAYSFPTRRQLNDAGRAVFAGADFVETHGYDLAERCPLLVLRRDP